MGRGLKDLTINLRNMFFMRKLKNVTVLNSIEAQGIIPGDGGSGEGLDRNMDLWGSDPVHPTTEAYKRLASKLTAKVVNLIEEPERRPS
jgi:hypothetical protein